MNDLFIMIKNKEFDKLLDHIKKHPDINLDIYDNNYNYLIQYIVLYNLYDILNYILNNRTIRLDILDTDGKNILYYPIKYNYNEIIKLLLLEDKRNIGVSLLDIRDNIGYISLHYSIIFDNFDAFKLIYQNSDINMLDNNGNNIYNICLQYKKSNILLFILENEIIENHNISHFLNSNGESILQSAINYNDMKVINYIINNIQFLKQIINNKEHEYGLTVLHQCIVLNYNDIINKLIKNGADINIADYLGNTPLHYSIIEKNYMITHYLIKENNLYYNQTNMNGNTALHIFLEEEFVNLTIIDRNKSSDDLYSILLKLIENTDLNIMNNNGDTILHLIAQKNLYTLEEIKNILIKKPLNLFIKNRENQTIIELSPNIINIAIDSYYNTLMNIKKDSSLEEWEKYCKYNDEKILKMSKQTNIEETCKKYIKKQIINGKKSMPITNELKLTIDSGIYLEGCFYTGSTIDILFGLIYLINNLNNITLLLEYPITHNSELENYYIKMGLNYSFKMEFSNIEIVWSFMKLIYPTNFDSILQSKQKNSSRYIVIPLGIEVSTGSHANILIIDTENKTIERFEPNGMNFPRGFYYNPELLDTLLSNKFSLLLSDYTYISPSEYLPTIGFQILETIEEAKCKKIGDPNGFCAAWCVWWTEQKLLNPDVPSKELAEGLINEIKFSNNSFKKLIRNYSIKIVKIRDEYLDKYNINIDDWMSGNYNEEIIDNIEKDILDKI
jgi:ankyrin repeat protein